MVCHVYGKVCPVCNRADVPFTVNRARPDGLQAQCRGCLRAINKRSRESHTGRERQRATRNNHRRRLRAYVTSYLRVHPCRDCGETDPAVLDFDHLRSKVRCVSEMVRDAVPLDVLVAEIAKCDVRCANCHRRRHATGRASLPAEPAVPALPSPGQ